MCHRPSLVWILSDLPSPYYLQRSADAVLECVLHAERPFTTLDWSLGDYLAPLRPGCRACAIAFIPAKRDSIGQRMRRADERAERASAWEPGRKQGRVRSAASRSRASYLGWGVGAAPRRRKDRGDLAAEGAAREPPRTGLACIERPCATQSTPCGVSGQFRRLRVALASPVPLTATETFRHARHRLLRDAGPATHRAAEGIHSYVSRSMRIDPEMEGPHTSHGSHGPAPPYLASPSPVARPSSSEYGGGRHFHEASRRARRQHGRSMRGE